MYTLYGQVDKEAIINTCYNFVNVDSILQKFQANLVLGPTTVQK